MFAGEVSGLDGVALEGGLIANASNKYRPRFTITGRGVSMYFCDKISQKFGRSYGLGVLSRRRAAP